jgi:hypothetical protein
MNPVPRVEHGPRGTPAEEFTPFFVQEEIQEGIEGNICITTGEPPEEMKQQSRQREHQEEAEAGMEAPPSSIL